MKNISFLHILVLFHLLIHSPLTFAVAPEQDTQDIARIQNTQKESSEKATPFIDGPHSFVLTDEEIQSQYVQYDQDKKFIEDLQKYTDTVAAKILAEDQQKDIPTPAKKKMFLYVFPRMHYLKSLYGSFWHWFGKKDDSYGNDSEKTQSRKEWETLLGVDVFHPYYKYKEAEKYLRDKYSFDFKGLKCRPEYSYSSNKLKLTFQKKF